MTISRHQINRTINQIDQEKKENKKYPKNEAKALLSIAYLTKLNTKKLMNFKPEQFIVEKGKLKILAWGKNYKINKTDPLAQNIIELITPSFPERYIFTYFRKKTTIQVNGKTYTRYNKTYEYWLKKWFGCKHVTPKDLMK